MRTSLLESIVGALNNPLGEQARKVAAWIKTSPPTLLHNLPNPDFRLDSNGLPIRWSDYGNRNSPYGWQIDYVMAARTRAFRIVDRWSPHRLRTDHPAVVAHFR